MNIDNKLVSAERVQISSSLSNQEIDQIINNPEIKVVQTNKPVDDQVWDRINDTLLQYRPDVQIRIYGHYSEKCNLSFLEKIPNVTNLSVDSLEQAELIETVTKLEKLRRLSIGIYSLESFDFLNQITTSLKKLFLGATKSNKPSLTSLKRFTALRELYIEGQEKDIEVIGEIDSLEKLVLRSVSVKNITFLRKLKNLWSLNIKLGGINDLTPLTGLKNLKYFELWQVRGLSDISVISTLSGLQYLFLQDLRNITSLPDATSLNQLRRVHLETMKGLNDISGIVKAPALEDFIHVNARNMSPEQYSELLKKDTLRRVSIGFGSQKVNKKMEQMMKNHGIISYSHDPFVFE